MSIVVGTTTSGLIAVKGNRIVNGIDGATVGTCITIVFITIVTRLHTSLNVTIAARGSAAVAQAGVGLDLVVVVTLFDTRLHMPVTTRSYSAIVEASIGLDFVVVIASLDTGLNVTIAARGCAAVI